MRSSEYMDGGQLTDLREHSRAEILTAVGDEPDVTLVLGLGNMGDRLIAAGAHGLLSDRRYRTITVDELAGAEGHTALMIGGGAFSQMYHEWATWALAVAELRFERVIVLPSTFEITVREVREALGRSEATVFARERVSFEAIRELCDARLALDASFFFDFGPFLRPGSGVLNAFREDLEAPDGLPLPTGNVDISDTAESLNQWLETIAEHAVVRTNRAHVVIAAALMGKEVQLGPMAGFKLQALADYALAGFPLIRLRGAASAPARTNGHRPRWPAPQSSASSRVAVARGGDWPEAQAVDGELTMLLADGVTLLPTALEKLIAELDEHPEALAAVPSVLGVNGARPYCGGHIREHQGVIDFHLADVDLEDEGHGRQAQARVCDWLPPPLVLVRSYALQRFPFAAEMVGYQVSAEWSYRVGSGDEGLLRRCAARAEYHPPAVGPVSLSSSSPSAPDSANPNDFRARCLAMPRLRGIAAFHMRHGLVLGELFSIFPGLVHNDGTRDADAARLLLELFEALGESRFLMRWCAGELTPIIEVATSADAREGLQMRLAEARARGAAATDDLHRITELLDEVRGTRAWRMATGVYRVRGSARALATDAVRSFRSGARR